MFLHFAMVEVECLMFITNRFTMICGWWCSSLFAVSSLCRYQWKCKTII